MNDPLSELRAANLDLEVHAKVLRSQVIKRLRARRAALKPALLLRVGSGMRKALGALKRTWKERHKQ